MTASTFAHRLRRLFDRSLAAATDSGLSFSRSSGGGHRRQLVDCGVRQPAIDESCEVALLEPRQQASGRRCGRRGAAPSWSSPPAPSLLPPRSSGSCPPPRGGGSTTRHGRGRPAGADIPESLRQRGPPLGAQPLPPRPVTGRLGDSHLGWTHRQHGRVANTDGDTVPRRRARTSRRRRALPSRAVRRADASALEPVRRRHAQPSVQVPRIGSACRHLSGGSASQQPE